jgi:hypothetical protein
MVIKHGYMDGYMRADMLQKQWSMCSPWCRNCLVTRDVFKCNLATDPVSKRVFL